MQIQDAMLQLLLKQPFYGYIAASVTPVESVEVPTIKMAVLPSMRLIYNKEWFELLQPEKAVGVIIHELLHIMLMHPFRKGNKEIELWVVACDMAVNEHISAELLPQNSITVEAISKEIGEKLPKGKSAEFYYDIISKTENRLSFIEATNEIVIVLKSGLELKANKQMESEASQVSKNAVKSIVSEILEQAEAEGEIPSGIQGAINEVYKGNEVNWRNVLKRFLSGKGKVLIRKSYKKESKRFENLPGNKRTVGINALLALDESGSISDKQIMKFYNELLKIKEITGACVSVTQFDTECTQPVPIGIYVRDKGRVKNGGTDFRPVFELADRMRIPLLIIFTDGDGTAPQFSNQRVLWVLTKGGKRPANFGHCITLDT